MKWKETTSPARVVPEFSDIKKAFAKTLSDDYLN